MPLRAQSSVSSSSQPMKNSKILLRCCAALIFSIALSTRAQTQTPQWIWTSKSGAPGEERYFRKTFDFRDPAVDATLTVSADARAEVFINGAKVATTEDWGTPVSVTV